MDGRHGERAGLAIVAERETRLLNDARCLIDSLSCAIPIHGSLLQVRDSIGYADPVYEYSKYSLTLMFSGVFLPLSPFPSPHTHIPILSGWQLDGIRFLGQKKAKQKRNMQRVQVSASKCHSRKSRPLHGQL
ncbi:hypothetical protein J3E69DRAFT_59337 [Trichoderma sp. SZMC 28015]